MSPATPEVTSQEAEASLCALSLRRTVVLTFSQALYTKAAQAELGKDYDRAFRHYVKAAEQFLSLSRHAPEGRLRTHYRGQANKALERAEKIKAVRRDVKPVAKDEFSESEQLYVLQKGSLVNQGHFPLWGSGDRPTSSTVQPPLSAEQCQHDAVWRRPDAGRHRVYSDEESVLRPQDVLQHVVSDCSVCGAVAVCIDHHRRFGSKMISSSLYPQDAFGTPQWSESGEYQFRILYNGGHRHINIDDQLPTSPGGTFMCMSTGDKGQLWPSLVEKAYMKLAGGYDFIGSALAGWIPEQIDIRSSEFQPEKTWSRLAEGYQSGECVLTLGTGERLPSGGMSARLLSAHSYAVIGVRNDEHRVLTVFDPWVRLPTSNEPGESTSEHREYPLHRVFEISWDEACNLFDGIYLSWNPELFKHQLTFHGVPEYVLFNPLILFKVSSHQRGQLKFDAGSGAGDVVWLHLTRHIRSHRSNTEYISLSAQGGSGVRSTPGRDVLSTKVRTAGQYTNASHVLVRTSLSAADVLTFVASYEGDRDDVGFTVTAYTNSKASWVQGPAKPPYSRTVRSIEGAFTPKSAGGNHTYPSYYLNPQYHLHVHPRVGGPSGRRVRDAKADVSLSLRGDRQVPMNITLAWSQGERINELGHNDLALSSGPYSYGYALASGDIPPGDYTLVVSAFEPRHTGQFDLRVESSDRFDVTPILQEGAGMFSKVIRGEWAGESAAGGPSFGKYAANPAYELHVSAVSQLRFRLQLARAHPTASLNLTIFHASAGATSSTHIATSGPYSDATSGVVIPQTTFQPGRYLAIPSTYNPGIQAGFVLIVYSTAALQVVPVGQRT
ncbi:hypothetical protein C2E23DRAFT_723547 [Lenzites betulinus]|nr:hypothetical protein C2E23DRAFT_723547 [Lenzites betulinus]